jgi:hypothetical protein
MRFRLIALPKPQEWHIGMIGETAIEGKLRPNGLQ